ncbi:MAG TPA: 50S ribosomal protein L31 [Candidatus Vogelbacteria bacterium]|nr:50S ribosomal protein L31 [Candidatus Vogelbacteria bacterium]
MKKDIHPEYFDKCQVKCACGNSFVIGSTKKEILIEVCSACHPFYTGQDKVMDTAGRVEKFRSRQKKAVTKKAVTKKTTTKKA